VVRWADGAGQVRTGLVRWNIPGSSLPRSVAAHPELLNRRTVDQVRQLAATLRDQGAIVHGLRLRVSGYDGSIWVLDPAGIELHPDGIPPHRQPAMDDQVADLEEAAAEVARILDDDAAAARYQAAPEPAPEPVVVPDEVPAPVVQPPDPGDDGFWARLRRLWPFGT
jgi:hypothetical protein